MVRDNIGRFLKGSKEWLGKKHTKKTKEKMSNSKKEWYQTHCISNELKEKRRVAGKKLIGVQNPNWKGDRVGLAGLHKWITSRKPKPEFCENCKNKKPYDLANISQKYKRNVNDFEWLCRKCHTEKDGRIKNLIAHKGIRGKRN